MLSLNDLEAIEQAISDSNGFLKFIRKLQYGYVWMRIILKEFALLVFSKPQASFATLHQLNEQHGFNGSYVNHSKRVRNKRVQSVLMTSVLAAITTVVGFTGSFSGVLAAACAVSTDTTIDQNYINTNSCDDINITSDAVITFTEAIDLGTGGYAFIVNSGVTATFSGDLILSDTADSIIINGTVTHAAVDAGGVNISAEDITVAASGSIDADGLGNTGQNGLGAAAGGGTSPGGAGYGGEGGGGGNLAGGTVYGSITAPTDLGSGGGGRFAASTGGSGGGYIRLNATGDVTIDGIITADGAASTYPSGSGGGSGGSVYITSNQFLGSGSISSDGGASLNNSGGSGGGGRIAMHTNTDSSSVTYTAYSAASTREYEGGAGTIYIKDTAISNGDLIIDNNDNYLIYGSYGGQTPLTPDGTPLSITLDEVILSNAGMLELNADTTINYTTFTWNNEGEIIDAGGTLALLATGADVTVPTTSRLFAETSKTWNSLIVDGVITTRQNFYADTYGVNLTISTDLDVDGSIAVDARGYFGQNGPGAGTAATSPGGGAYGGEGGEGGNLTAGNIYGSITAPTDIGSGGGARFSAFDGGRGGGRIQLAVTGTTTINGTVSANGANSSYGAGSGGGSGGSVYLTTGTLAGSGTVSSNGGTSANNSGGTGSGGRIAVYYTTDSSTLNYQAYSGISTNRRAGGAGTIYTKAAAAPNGDLLIDNNNQFLTLDFFSGQTPLTLDGTPATFTFDTITVSNNGILELNADTTLNYTSLDWSNEGEIIDGGGTMALLATGADVVVPSTARLYADTARTWNSLTVDGTLTHRENWTADTFGIDLTIIDDVDIAGSVNISQRGYRGRSGPGAGGGGTSPGGGSYGGRGGEGGSYTATDVYGSITDPVDLGSGGGARFSASDGGKGGGKIKLTVGDTITINGTVESDGTNSTYGAGSGGGSGGSVNITADTLAGSGVITSNGGTSANSSGGSGSGGRIAMLYTTDSSSLTYQLYGGGGFRDRTGAAGTLYTKAASATNGDLLIDNNGQHLENWLQAGNTVLTPDGTPATVTFDTITLQNNGVLLVNSDATINYTTLNWSGGEIVDGDGTMAVIAAGADLVVPVNAYLYPHINKTFNNATINGTVSSFGNTTAQVYGLDLSFTGDVEVTATGAIRLDNKGYTNGSGPGAGVRVGSYATGAGHGGIGGDTSFGGTPGPTYDVAASPVLIGSGGGYSNVGAGSRGGGAVKLDIAGRLTVDGSITASATDTPGARAAGGSGGSIWLISGSLTGAGAIEANGGAATIVGSGAGGGGLISIECDVSDYSGTFSVATGTNGVAGDPGVVTQDCTNVAPSFTGTISDPTTNEDTTATGVFDLDDYFSDDPGDRLGYSLIDPFSLGTITINADGTVDIVPTGDAAGTDTIQFRATDLGALTADSNSLIITVTEVNDAPSFTKGADESITEDDGAQTVSGWATAMLAGPASESGQTLSFNISTSNNALFSALPAVSTSTGNLTYTPIADGFGTATVTISISDDGGTANSGVDTSADQTFDIVVAADNDTPTFSGPITISSWDEDTDRLDEIDLDDYFADVDTGDACTYSIPTNPANITVSIDPVTNEVDFEPSADFNGTESVVFRCTDASLATVDSNTISLTVDAVNDTPVAEAGSGITIAEDDVTGTLDGTGSSDIDGTPLTYSWQEALDADDVCTLTNATSDQPTISINGAEADTTCTYSLEVSDGVLTSVADTVIVTVTADNDASTITTIPPQQVNENETASFTVTVVDDDTPVVDIQLQDTYGELAAAGITIADIFTDNGNNTGTFAWRTTYSDAGTYRFTVVVDDGATVVQQEVQLTVNNVSRQPVFVGQIPNVSTGSGTTTDDLFDLDDFFSSDFGDDLDYVVEGEDQVTVEVDDENVVSLTIPASFEGSETITFIAYDEYGEFSASNSIVITADALADETISHVIGTNKGKGIISVIGTQGSVLAKWKAFGKGGVVPQLVDIQGQLYIFAIKKKSGSSIHVYNTDGDLIRVKRLSARVKWNKLVVGNLDNNPNQVEVVLATRRKQKVKAKVYTYNTNRLRFSARKSKRFNGVKTKKFSIELEDKRVILRNKKDEQIARWKPFK